MDGLEKRGIKLKTAQIIALGFLGLIFTGACILYLPISSAPGVHTSFIDALFTATTSVCVTGLVTVTTASQWSIFGKVIVTILIQLGGFGIITFSTIVLMAVGKRISIKNRRLIQESYNLSYMNGLAKLIIRIVKGTLVIEGIGMLLYCTQFIPEFGFWRGLGYSAFNAVSAFCNAGMDIIGENSLANYVTNPVVNFTTMWLIIMGGIGYIVWWDVLLFVKRLRKKETKLNYFWRELQLHTKIVLVSTGVLIFGGAYLIYLFEYGNQGTMGYLNRPQTFMAAMFQSVTCRTAGFFTIAQDKLTTPSVMISMILMFIGGSPMGTAGGVKTTTACILLLTSISFFRGKRDTEAFRRRILLTNIRTAMIVTLSGFTALFISTLCLSTVVTAPFVDILYETTSAIGTVGLTRGITPFLPTMGKIIIIITMYIGRIGPVTLATAVTVEARKKARSMHLPEEKILIG